MKLILVGRLQEKLILVKWIDKYKTRIIACHFKDFYSNDDMLSHSNQSSIGKGFINWKIILEKISKTQCQVIAIEHDDPRNYKEYITKSLDYLETIKMNIGIVGCGNISETYFNAKKYLTTLK